MSITNKEQLLKKLAKLETMNDQLISELAYVDHLSHNGYFLAYNAVPAVVTQQSQGIYNMGRNIGFKLLFPIGGHRISDGEVRRMKEY